MANLTEDQIRFLTYYRLPLSLLFDASGMRTADYKIAMKKEGKCFAYGVTRCLAGGHSLRTRAGHCVQCDPSKIAYMMRHVSPGEVYIAGSLAGSFLKIGSSSSVFEREDSLRNSRYANRGDWRILAYGNCKEAGKVEGETQARLARWRVSAEYQKGWTWQQCYELFSCNFEDARVALETSLKGTASITVRAKPELLARYSFRE